MEAPLREISSIKFDLLSSDEIKQYSGIEINETKQTGHGSVCDPRMGIDSNSDKCTTCDGKLGECPGHFGYIELSVPLFHPLKIELIMNYLSLYCIYCFKFLIKQDILKLFSIPIKNIHENMSKSLLKSLIHIMLKMKYCHYCNELIPRFTRNEDVIEYFYETEEKKKIKIEITPEFILDNFIKNEGETLISFKKLVLTILPVLPICDRPSAIVGENSENKGHDDLTYKYIDIIKYNNNIRSTKINEKTKQEYIRCLKFHIRTLFDNSKGKAKQYHGVRPIKCIRSRMTGKHARIRGNLMGKRCDNSARTVFDVDPNLKIGQVGLPTQYYEKITFPERVFSKNLEEMKKLVNEGKATRIIREEDGKEKYFNIDKMREYNIIDGKINPVPKLNYDDLVYRSKTLIVSEDNAKYIKSLLRDRMIKKEDFKLVNIIGASIRYTEIINPEVYLLLRGKPLELIPSDIIKPSSGKFKKINKIPQIKQIDIKEGDIVERYIKDGDYVVYNRQPSLHKPSILAGTAKKIPTKTMRLNTANCKGLNADADGDELNNHFPQSYMTKAELSELLYVGKNMLSGRDSGVVLGICQDTISFGYRSTKNDKVISKEDFFQIINQIDDWDMTYIFNKMKHIKKVLKKHSKNKKLLYSGRGIFSMLLPDDLEITYNRNDDICSIITEGVLISGYVDKNLVGAKPGSLIQVLALYYSHEIAEKFASNYQIIYDHWGLLTGFSIGLQDCVSRDIIIPSDEKNTEHGLAFHQAQKEITNCFVEAKLIFENEKNEVIKELKINGILNKANAIGDKIAKDSLYKENAFVDMIKSGAKGSWVNIPQIITNLGQQNVNGERIQKTFRGRTLPHYNRSAVDFLDPMMDETEAISIMFESRGFVRNSLLKGLNPKEFFFHACGGRVGIIETGIKTATTGYISRRLVKKMEDVKVNYFSSVSSAKNNIYAFEFNDGFDPSMSTVVNGVPQFCNIKLIIDRLNKQFENENNL
jgi:DNA-directed RNA polymerase beta' subunit